MKEAQQAVVEFLLDQPPARLPRLRQGRRVPAAGHLLRLGRRPLALHRAQAPLREAARALAADRDRPRALHPLLPLRALLPGDRRGLPAGPPGARRAHVRRHVRRPPLRRAVQRQHHRAVPGGRADLAALPLPRAAVGHRGRGLGLHAVPGAVQRHLHRPRRARPARARRATTPRSTTAGSATRAASPTRPIHVDERITQPLVRDGGELRPVSWERALDEAAAALDRAPRARRRAGRRRRHQRGGLPPAAPGARGPGLHRPRLARPRRARRGRCTARSPRPRCRRRSPTSSSPTPCSCSACEPVDDMPILDLRIRKGVRRHGVKLAVATSRPSSLDANAKAVAALRARRRRGVRWARWTPRCGGGRAASTSSPARPAHGATQVRALAELAARRRRGRRDPLRRAPARGPRGGTPRARCSTSPAGSACAGRDGAGLLERPAAANGRGLREAGVLPDAGPGLRRRADAGPRRRRDRRRARRGRARPRSTCCAPTRSATCPTAAPGTRALERATTVVAHAGFLTEGLREHATVVFPAESYAEKEGTVTHPDGRVQRLRPAIGHPGEVRAEWQVLADLGASARPRPRRAAPAPMAPRAALRGGALLRRPDARGDRRPRRALAGARRRRGLRAAEPAPLDARGAAAPRRRPTARLRLGTYRSIWAAPEVEASPALQFLRPHQRVGALARRRRAPRRRRRRQRRRRRRRRTRRRDGRRCAPRSRRARVFLETATPERRGQRPRRRRRRWRCDPRDRPSPCSPTSTTTSPGGSRSSRRS